MRVLQTHKVAHLAFLWNVPKESADYKRETVSFRRKLQKLAPKEPIFFDQNDMKEEPQPLLGLTP
jgi:hypothetical protein